MNPRQLEQRVQQLVVGGRHVGSLHKCVSPRTDGQPDLAVFQEHFTGCHQMVDAPAFLIGAVIKVSGLAPLPGFLMSFGDIGQLVRIAFLKVQ